MQDSKNRLMIFSGNANRLLAEEIAARIGCELGKSQVSRFSDGEIQVRVEESVRGADCYVLQPTSQPVHDNLMELLILVDALRRASARRITAVIPYYGYARQDRKTRARDPITAKLVANLIITAGARRVLTMDLHAGQIQGFFDVPVDHLTAIPLLAEYWRAKGLEDAVVVAPDIGGVARASDLADRLRAPLAIVDKRRPAPNVAEVRNIIGKVRNKNVIMLDDMIDTAGSFAQGALAMLERGAKNIYASCTHPVLSGPALTRLEESPIREVVVCNTISLPEPKRNHKIKVISVGSLFAEAIIRIHEDLSVSKLFD